MKRYYWLKLKEDFFRQRQIKRLRKIAGGDTYTIIYLKMMLLAMKENGRIALDGQNFSEELALELDEEPENVQITVSYLLSSGLMEEISTNEMFVPEAVSNVGSESTSAERVRRFRQKQELAKLGTDEKRLISAEALHCNADVTTEIRDKRKEIREEKEREEEQEAAPLRLPAEAARPSDPVPYSRIQDLFNSTCKSLSKVQRLTEGRRKKIAARWKDLGKNIEAFRELFEKTEASDFLTGTNERGWRADFDWLMKPANATKVLEGNYDNRNHTKGDTHHDDRDRTAPKSSDPDYWRREAARQAEEPDPDFFDL